ncbi:hypothetical protein MPSEU_000192800 [Mayamaea pseudoterrestris]|nr:hypothetical protein MPSEU_000192800 [Mayamaea pseudoterrestris]
MSDKKSPPRPGKARIDRLRMDRVYPTVSSFFDLIKYYEAAEKLYNVFQEVYLLKQLDEAFVFGERYCYFCTDEEKGIPSHAYYLTKENAELKRKHHMQVSQVIDQLKTVMDWIDQEEIEKELQQQIEEDQKQRALGETQQAKLNDFQRRLEQQQQEQAKPTGTPEQVQKSAFDKLARLSNGNHKAQQEHSSSRKKQDPSGDVPTGKPSSRYGLMDVDSEDDESDELPPPVLPPPANGDVSQPPPPSYHTVASRRNFLGQAKVHPTNLPPPQQDLPPTPKPLTMSQLTQQYKQAYIEFHHAGRIRVTPIPSYQGRIPASTNGCTVISALVAANHLRRDLVTDTIVRIMDQDCVPLLQQIRSKLGLGGCALIIPSDVHDHLVDRKVLKQNEFEGAAGGNILDPIHFGSFTKLLAVGDDGKGHTRRAAATLFFRDHVISIVKMVGGGKVRYDLVDSLPGMTMSGQPMATRTHCQDLESLEVLLKWYCSRKFSESNCTYIDRNSKWDDAMADFDPRVFQGFVWMPKQ